MDLLFLGVGFNLTDLETDFSSHSRFWLTTLQESGSQAICKSISCP